MEERRRGFVGVRTAHLQQLVEFRLVLVLQKPLDQRLGFRKQS